MEVFAMTSWGPARSLGLTDRGHLGVGARADICCYNPQPNVEAMFACPSWVMRGGEVVVREGEIVHRQAGQTLAVKPEWDEGRRHRIYKVMHDATSIAPEDYALGDKAHPELKAVPCKSKV
jgi:formylmethanofuran dehydrogenase subunit A